MNQEHNRGYQFDSIEKKWQDRWIKNALYQVHEDNNRPKYYVLDMFPYPSGAGLHVGHPLGYIASDIVSRYKRMNGFNVLHPMGFDAFGLPAEQYAVQTGQHPAITTAQNIEKYKSQLGRLGFSFDWSREVQTCDPSYYKWTQWIFIQLFESWYNVNSDKAESIDSLVTIFENEGNINVLHAGDEVDHFTASEWADYSDLQKEDILQNYRLAFLKTTTVNWCEELGTVLANEEVKDGLSERGGFPVVKKEMRQWFLRITAYSERLLTGLNSIDWSESLKEMQRNWIGKSVGAYIQFSVQNSSKELAVFTTRPDTIFGCSFMVIAPEHPMVEELTQPDQQKEVESYVNEAVNRSERERMSDVKRVSGSFTGSYCIHPFTKELLPIWISDYVLMGYGTGAIMAVPGHDDRDHAFAKKFDLPIMQVVKTNDEVDVQLLSIDSKEGELINSDMLNGLSVKEAIPKSIEAIEKMGIGDAKTQYRLRDAGFGRQRYWGEPIPITYQDSIPQTINESELPLTLPEVKSYKPAGDGRSPLARLEDWVRTKNGTRETDTMPGWAGSSWYFLRYMDPSNSEAPFSAEKVNYWKQVDLYIGGSEHATGHLLYARFWTKFLHDRGYLPFDEPFKKLLNQGMIQGVIESVYLKKSEDGSNIFYSSDMVADGESYTQIPVHVDFVQNYGKSDQDSFLDAEGMRQFIEWRSEYQDAQFVTNHGTITLDSIPSDLQFYTVSEVGKMSKSKFNVVNPDDICDQYGADTLRLYEMFLGPITDAKPWDTKGIEGTHRFLKKCWNFYVEDDGTTRLVDEKPTKENLKSLHKTIEKITADINQFSFNTSISQFMICLNELQQQNCKSLSIGESFIQLLAPFAPHFAEEIWNRLGHDNSVHESAWPTFNPEFLKESEITYPVSVNGKTRGEVVVPADANPKEVENAALELENVRKWIEGKTIRKVIVVPGRIVNVVV
jgi:leucyl-tRNA synthetase